MVRPAHFLFPPEDLSSEVFEKDRMEEVVAIRNGRVVGMKDIERS